MQALLCCITCARSAATCSPRTLIGPNVNTNSRAVLVRGRRCVMHDASTAEASTHEVEVDVEVEVVVFFGRFVLFGFRVAGTAVVSSRRLRPPVICWCTSACASAFASCRVPAECVSLARCLLSSAVVLTSLTRAVWGLLVWCGWLLCVLRACV